MNTLKAVITDNHFGNLDIEKSILEPAGFEVAELPPRASEHDIAEGCADADAVIVNMAKITSRVIESLGKCRIISRYGTGYDNVDAKAAVSKGIWVANVPDYCVDEVSEHALAMVFSWARQLSAADASVRDGSWRTRRKPSRIAGSVLGIIGFGRIGKRLAEKASAIGFSEILAWSPSIASGKKDCAPAKPAAFGELLERSDWVSIHIPLEESTRHLVGKRELESMKKSAFIINTSRGSIIDENALIDALRNGTISGAGLDAFETEPLPGNSVIASLGNTILSGHDSFRSNESIVRLREGAALNVKRLFTEGKPVNPVRESIVLVK